MTTNHRIRAEELVGQISVSTDKALEAASVHALLNLGDQLNALAVVLAANLRPASPADVRVAFAPGAAQFGPASKT